MPFEDSRRLTGSNLFFDSPGAVLETAGIAVDEALLEGWRRRVFEARRRMQWPGTAEAPGPTSDARGLRAAQRSRAIAIRRHAAGTSLALAAPCDQLFTATEINEWALCAALVEVDPMRWNALESAIAQAARQAAQAAGPVAPGERAPMAVAFGVAPPVLGEDAALARFARLSMLEAAPELRRLIIAAQERDLQCVLDDELLTLGGGAGSHTWPLDSLPAVADVPWARLRNVPSAIVTGSNGKTTTVRLLAACARAQGWLAGYNCTDGLFVGAEKIESGDYSGPAGTRAVLRDPRVGVAILETARGGILRRGLAAGRADVAVVTNVSADHFGEYGIHDLAGLADVKLVVASTIDAMGLLVLNAEDPLLRARAAGLGCPIGWFARDFHNPVLLEHRLRGGATSGVREGRLIVTGLRDQGECDLGAVLEMPLTVEGSAAYNVSNIAGAVLAALQLGVAPATVATVLGRFGADPADNPGRLMRFEYRGAQVLVDYAHNPEGLGALLEVAVRLRRTGRLALLLGQAGNRETVDIERLADTAARFRPDFVMVKEIENYLRGRAAGEVPAIIRAALLKGGMHESSLEIGLTELAAVSRVLAWSRPGDVLVLPVHDRAARAATMTLIRPG